MLYEKDSDGCRYATVDWKTGEGGERKAQRHSWADPYKSVSGRLCVHELWHTIETGQPGDCYPYLLPMEKNAPR